MCARNAQIYSETDVHMDICGHVAVLLTLVSGVRLEDAFHTYSVACGSVVDTKKLKVRSPEKYNVGVRH